MKLLRFKKAVIAEVKLESKDGKIKSPWICSLCVQRSVAMKDLGNIHVYTCHCVPEILRFALNDKGGKK